MLKALVHSAKVMDLLAQPGGVGRWADPHPVQRRLEPALGLGKVEAGDRVWRSKVPTHRRSREAASGRLSGPRHRHPGGHVFGALSRGLVPYPPPPTTAHGSCASGSKAGKDRSPPTSNGRDSQRTAVQRRASHRNSTFPARSEHHPGSGRDRDPALSPLRDRPSKYIDAGQSALPSWSLRPAPGRWLRSRPPRPGPSRPRRSP